MKLNALMVRYIVNDVELAAAFYTQHLGFRAVAPPDRAFALLERDNLQLVLSPPEGPGGGSQPLADGSRPRPGGFNRIIVRTTDLDGDAARLKKAGVVLRSGVIEGPGGRQVVVEDPSGNLVELFEAAG